ncbi:MAG: magnesium and cobalt transport protein CorA, partial [Deltaproteobacteria bacterium]|nr:magnesium and cobalt transport protein CorA [Deltaproteobacteria bacterium]
PGQSPGTLVYVGDKREEKIKISVIDYDSEYLEEKEVQTIEECLTYKDKETVTWINVSGIHDIGVIEVLGKHFALHPLLLEDILNTGHRPKMDDYEDHLFIVMKMLHEPEGGQIIQQEHISIILTPKIVISLQEYEGDIFDPVRERIRKKKGRIRTKGTDYLTYALIDTIESFRDMISGLQDIYLSSVSNRMNEVMKVLTIIATIFIPMTFVAGIYGMNFKFMPELEWRWADPGLLLILVTIFISLVFWFRRRKWL